ncbi:MAG: hypothetical protein KDC05_06660 [Bacteroidales bacterium]|nr:hypothetical protein [Bacteroidales bacterium]
MKTSILTAALVVLTTVIFAQQENTTMKNDFAMASDDVSIAFYPKTAEALTMIMTKDEDQKIKVRFSDEDNKILFQRKYSKVSGTKVTYDVSEFPSGEYTFEVVKDKEVVYSKTFSKRDGAVALVD